MGSAGGQLGLADGNSVVGKVTVRKPPIHGGRLEVATDVDAVEAPKERVAALPNDAERCLDYSPLDSNGDV